MRGQALNCEALRWSLRSKPLQPPRGFQDFRRRLSMVHLVLAGSWLVLEQWMVPDVFAVVDGSPYGEYQLMQYGIQQNRTAKLRAAIQVTSLTTLVAVTQLHKRTALPPCGTVRTLAAVICRAHTASLSPVRTHQTLGRCHHVSEHIAEPSQDLDHRRRL